MKLKRLLEKLIGLDNVSDRCYFIYSLRQEVGE